MFTTNSFRISKILFTNILVLLVTMLPFIVMAKTERYRLMLRDNPSSSIVIAWDQVSGKHPVVYYGTKDCQENWHAYPYSHQPDRVVSYKDMNNHFVRLKGLLPNTNYYFVIKDSEGTSKRYWFKTCPDSPDERFSFIAGGDSRNNYTPRKNANKLVAKLKPHAVFFGGDMTVSGTDSQWKEWLDHWQLTIAADGRMFPLVVARGNHESSNSMLNKLFDVPNPNVYYAVNFGNSLLRAYTLNTETSILGAQTKWLKQDLQSAQTVWKIAQYHKPMRPHVEAKDEGDTQYAAWAKLFFQYQVNLVIECDAHTVKTTWPVEPSRAKGSDEGFIRNDKKGTVYIGEGCWGAPLRPSNDAKEWTRDHGKFNQFKWFFVDQNSIEIRTVKVDNADKVGEVSNTNPFVLPINLDLWSPKNGEVVLLSKNGAFPQIALSSPTNGAYFPSQQTIELKAQASDEDGEVAKVDFFANGNLIGSCSKAPFKLNWEIAQDATYTLTTQATDNKGNVSISKPILVHCGTIEHTLSIPISQGNDDVEQNGEDGSIYTNSTDLELVQDGHRGNQTIGLLFRKIQLPKNAKIKKAFIQFTSEDTEATSTTLTIYGEKNSNVEELSTENYALNHIKKTLTFVQWKPKAWRKKEETGPNQQTPNLKSILQEIIDLPNWKPGNNLVITINGKGMRTAESYDGMPSAAPVLIVNYHMSSQ